MSSTPAPTPSSKPPPKAGSSPAQQREYSEGPIPESVAWSVTAYLISGPFLYGGIGFALDAWLGTSFLVVVGILGGMALALYLIWVRYGTS